MVTKKTSLIFVFWICAAGAWLLYLKYNVMEIEDHIKYLKRSISEEKRTSHILKAEWKTLVTPERIRRLTQRHLNLAQVSGSQLREYDASIFHDDASRFKPTKKLCKLVSEIIMQQGDE